MGEVVVTSTRQTSTVNRVPLSVTASTQQAIDQQGIRNISDLSRAVPGLSVSSALSQGIATFSIRGISSVSGAATVGVYLDDVSVTKRQISGAGGNSNINGTPLPALFDLERVEVLRGPQGTLYGGSSQGGTIRFITPTPSLTAYSTYVRAQASTTRFGDPSYELGVAAGGPIVEDKLGFRASVYGRHTGGYIDHVDPYNPSRINFKDSNSGKTFGMRAALLWAPTERARIGLQLYMSRDKVDDGSSYTLPTGTITTPQRCTSWQGFGLAGGRPRLTNCAAPTTPITYVYPQQVYGPFNQLRPFQTISYYPNPVTSSLKMGSVTVDYEFDQMTVRSITSYFKDDNKSDSWNTTYFGADNGITPPGSNAINITPDNPLGLTPNIGMLRFPNGQPLTAFGVFGATNKRFGMSQELRFTSNTDGPVTWVAGAYYAYARGKAHYVFNADYDTAGLILYGLTTAQRFAEINADPARGALLPRGSTTCTAAAFASGACFSLPQSHDPAISAATRHQALSDTEIAAFGDVTWHVTDRLNLLAGLRVSRVEFDYRQIFYGLNSGFNVPTVINSGIVSGIQKEVPITPKFGVQYQFSPTSQVYATAAKGFRPGGVNSPLSTSLCTGLAAAGLTPQDLPTTYEKDTVWSYELGEKMRLFNRVQINSAVYRIDWSGVQTTIPTTGCGQTYTTNAGTARSQGFDLEVEARLFSGFVANLALGYNDAEYTSRTTGPTPLSGAAPTVIINEGDKLPVPPWSVSIGGQYNFSMSNGLDAYVRADYRYTSSYEGSAGPGSSSYTPSGFNRGAADFVNARIGVRFGDVDLNVFANNLFDSRDYLSQSGGRSGCSPTSGPECSTYNTYSAVTEVNTFRPREIGVQLVYRH